MTHQLASCALGDFGLWSSEQETEHNIGAYIVINFNENPMISKSSEQCLHRLFDSILMDVPAEIRAEVQGAG